MGTLCSCASIYIYAVPVGLNCKELFTTIIILKYFGVGVIATATIIIIIILHNLLPVDGSDIPIAGM